MSCSADCKKAPRHTTHSTSPTTAPHFECEKYTASPCLPFVASQTLKGVGGSIVVLEEAAVRHLYMQHCPPFIDEQSTPWLTPDCVLCSIATYKSSTRYDSYVELLVVRCVYGVYDAYSCRTPVTGRPSSSFKYIAAHVHAFFHAAVSHTLTAKGAAVFAYIPRPELTRGRIHHRHCVLLLTYSPIAVSESVLLCISTLKEGTNHYSELDILTLCGPIPNDTD